MTYIIKAFPEFVGKSRQELYNYLQKEGYKLAKIPDDLTILPDEMKDEKWYFFFGSVLRGKDGRWDVSYVDCYGSGFYRGAGWLDLIWGASERVVLEEEKNDLYEKIKDDPKEIIAFAKREIKEYQDLIDMMEKRLAKVKNIKSDVGGDDS